MDWKYIGFGQEKVGMEPINWWWPGRPGMLQVMKSQRVGHDWTTDLIWSDIEYDKIQNTNTINI